MIMFIKWHELTRRLFFRFFEKEDKVACMLEPMSKSEYEKQNALTRDRRMSWWREARFGMFVHYGLYSQVGRGEWAMAMENCPVHEYEDLAGQFMPKPGAPREWAALARKAGMKYMVLTTRHCEGFSLWDSKVNPYNSMNFGPRRDIVKEFVDACHEYDLKIGFYSVFMDWHHPDGWRCAFDTQARIRFTAYIRELDRELLTRYGKIDILWHDCTAPIESWEGCDSLELNRMARELQPDILINDRSLLDEDFSTPEESIRASDRDWEACMTFNGISWGYVDSAQAAPYSFNAQGIIKMLNVATSGGGNLLLNIGPEPDGSVPAEAAEPLATVGKWLEENGKAVYGKKIRSVFGSTNGVCGTSRDDSRLYIWNWAWPGKQGMVLGGFMSPVKGIRLLRDGTPIEFEQLGHRIVLKNIPEAIPDEIAGIAVMEMELDGPLEFHNASYYPQIHGGMDYAGDKKI